MCDDVEVGLERDMKPDIPHSSVLTFSFVDPSKTVPTTFILPKDTGRLVVYLFDISMYKTIDHTYRVISESKTAQARLRLRRTMTQRMAW